MSSPIPPGPRPGLEDPREGGGHSIWGRGGRVKVSQYWGQGQRAAAGRCAAGGGARTQLRNFLAPGARSKPRASVLLPDRGRPAAPSSGLGPADTVLMPMGDRGGGQLHAHTPETAGTKANKPEPTLRGGPFALHLRVPVNPGRPRPAFLCINTVIPGPPPLAYWEINFSSVGARNLIQFA